MRILNRHATEMKSRLRCCLESVEQDQLQLIHQREKALAEFQDQLPELEETARKSNRQVTAELAEAIARIDPELPERETEHAI